MCCGRRRNPQNNSIKSPLSIPEYKIKFSLDNGKAKKKITTPIKERITYFMNTKKKNVTGNSLEKITLIRLLKKMNGWLCYEQVWVLYELNLFVNT